MDYSFKPTTHGRAVIAACMALGEPPDICRVAFGGGRIDEEANLADQHELLDYVADGTIANRRHKDDHFYFEVQYLNSDHPGISTFNLSEFIVYIKDPETGLETDLLYGTLGDYRLPVPKYHESIAPSVFNLPLALVISDEITVTVSAPPGLVTYKDLEDAVSGAVEDAVRDTGYRGAECVISTIAIRPTDWVRDDMSMDPDGWDYHADIRALRSKAGMFPSLAIHPDSTGTAKQAAICPAAQALDGAVRVWCKSAPDRTINATLALIGESAGSAACIVADITIQPNEWVELEEYGAGGTGMDEYRWQVIHRVAEARESMYPSIAPHKASLKAVARCGLCPTVQSLDGAVRLWAREQPTAAITATIALQEKNGSRVIPAGTGGVEYAIPIADADTLGVIKIGSGLNVAPDGTASVDMTNLSDEDVERIAERVIPSEDEVNAMLDENFQPYEPDPNP